MLAPLAYQLKVTFEDFKKQVLVEDEGKGDATRDNNIRAVLENADFVFTNNGTPEELYAQVEKALVQKPS